MHLTADGNANPTNASPTLTLEQLCSEIKRRFGGQDYTIFSRQFGDGGSEDRLVIGDVVAATWKGRLVTIPPCDGKTPRGPKEYYDFTLGGVDMITADGGVGRNGQPS
jgi:hypothetical protein